MPASRLATVMVSASSADFFVLFLRTITRPEDGRH
jgi:hypothetical protein